MREDMVKIVGGVIAALASGGGVGAWLAKRSDRQEKRYEDLQARMDKEYLESKAGEKELRERVGTLERHAILTRFTTAQEYSRLAKQRMLVVSGGFAAMAISADEERIAIEFRLVTTRELEAVEEQLLSNAALAAAVPPSSSGLFELASPDELGLNG